MKNRYADRRAKGLCGWCGADPEPGRSSCRPCLDKRAETARVQRNRPNIIASQKLTAARRRAVIRAEALSAYGGRCACCGETEHRYLELDHIDGGGNQHRRDLGLDKAGAQFYRAIRKLGWPAGLQVLCANCHTCKTHYGGCWGEHGELAVA